MLFVVETIRASPRGGPATCRVTTITSKCGTPPVPALPSYLLLVVERTMFLVLFPTVRGISLRSIPWHIPPLRPLHMMIVITVVTAGLTMPSPLKTTKKNGPDLLHTEACRKVSSVERCCGRLTAGGYRGSSACCGLASRLGLFVAV